MGRCLQAAPAARVSEAPLLPLARAQDAVARLEASAAAAPDNVAAGLRARLALLDAAGFLTHPGGPAAVRPHDLALGDAGLTDGGADRPAQAGGAVETLAPPLAQLGAALADDAPTHAWLVALPGPARCRA